MTKRGQAIAVALGTLAVVAFFNNPEQGQGVLMGLFNWIWPW